MARGSGGDHSMKRELAELLRRAMHNREARRVARGGGRAVPIAAGEASSAPLATTQKWLDELRLIGRELPFELCNWQINQFADFDIKRIYRSGEI